MPPKSIFRQPGAKHFQLVHRSQRDPLIHDPDASQHVLKEIERGNTRKGKSRADLEKVLSTDELIHDVGRANIGEASLYGVYYDDTGYDYMQHLRTVGVQEDGVDSVLLEAPMKTKSKGKSKDPMALIELPPEALPSTSEIPRNSESQQTIPSSISGFQPDMDPHLRQVLEALEDDAFVDDDAEDEFFGELVADGERGETDHIEFEFFEGGAPDEVGGQVLGMLSEDTGENEGWEAQFQKFKKAQKVGPLSDHSDVYSDGGDTIGTLPTFSVIGRKNRRKGTSDASGYSMSSSSVFRNEALTTLDEQFDQIQREYDSDQNEEEEGSDTDSAPELITSREDFDSMMNEFLDNYEILGGKMRPVLPGDTATEKLDTIRKAFGRVRIREQDDEGGEEDDILMPLHGDNKDRWDCETILTTYSNLENHPRLIRARTQRPVPKIRLDPKTGLPFVETTDHRKDEQEPSSEESSRSTKTTITRSKNETKEEKKLRKQAVKAERQVRRADKKATKEQYSTEIRNQTQRLSTKEKTKMRKL